MYYIKGLFESPKVYLYTGNPGDEVTENSFIEVNIKGQTTITENYKRTMFNIKCTVELPKRNTMTL